MIMLKKFERSAHLAELKVSYKRRRKTDPAQVSMPWVVSGCQSAAEYLRSVWSEDRFDYCEDFVMVCLNAAGEPIGWVRLATGGINSASVDPRVVFGVALVAAATSIIVAHNHPSGNLEPSQADKLVTRRIKEAGNMIGVQLLDHIILSRTDSFSFAEQGLL